MGKKTNYFNTLDDGPLSFILSQLPSPQDLACALATCRRFHEIGIEENTWRNMCMTINPSMTDTLRAITKTVDARNFEDLPIDKLDSDLLQNLDKKISSEIFCQLAWEFTKPPDRRNQIRRAIRASSTDNYPEEAIEKTLQPSPKWPNPNTPSYWSSKGKANPSEPETLTYELESPVSLIHEVWIRPFQAYFQSGEPIYSSRAVRFKFGYRVSQPVRRLSDYQGKLSRQRITEVLLNEPEEEYVWTYVSPEFPMKKVDAMQRFTLPNPALCIGGILQVELLDRVQAQRFDELFYICICHVKAIGRPLPRFDCEPNSDRQTVTLKLRNPKSALRGAVAGLSEAEVRSRVAHRRASIHPQVAEAVIDELERRLVDIRNSAAVDDVALDVLNWLLDNADTLPADDILLRMLQSAFDPNPAALAR